MFEMAQTYLVYHSGKEPALKSPNEWAVEMDPFQAIIWFYHRGGLKMFDDILAKHDLAYVGATTMAGEHFWSRVPLNSVADVKGKKMRASGLAADMAALLGASVVTVPGGEIYSALERGVIDFCEFTSQTVNYGLGLHEVTKYIVNPTYSGGGSYDWFANRKAWNSLPADLRRIVVAAIHETGYIYYGKSRLETQIVNEKLRKHGMTFINWSEKDMDVVNKARIAALEKYAAASPAFAQILKSRMELLKDLGYKH
jgi:TRAP-type mannitol/chloroaromatic compound transport system substrate-binding protein